MLLKRKSTVQFSLSWATTSTHDFECIIRSLTESQRAEVFHCSFVLICSGNHSSLAALVEFRYRSTVFWWSSRKWVQLIQQYHLKKKKFIEKINMMPLLINVLIFFFSSDSVAGFYLWSKLSFWKFYLDDKQFALLKRFLLRNNFCDVRYICHLLSASKQIKSVFLTNHRL